MASETKSEEVQDQLEALPPELRPSVEHLVTEDDRPVDNIFSEKQQRLLTEPLYSSWSYQPFVALSNVGLFYAIDETPYVPDALLSLDVELPADVWPKAHRSYFVWYYGKPPDVVIEVVSNRRGLEDSEKLQGYAKIGISYYAIYDPQQLLSGNPLRIFLHDGKQLSQVEPPPILPGIGLGLQLWQGRYENLDAIWLRWTDEDGQLIPTGRESTQQERERAEKESERAEKESERAEKERQRAEQERERAERLAEQIRKLGIEPEQ